MTVDLLLEELDTVPDLVGYLKKKEEFMQQPGVIVFSQLESFAANPSSLLGLCRSG